MPHPPIGKGPGVRGAAGGGEGHAPGPRPGRNAGGWTDAWDWGTQVPGETPATPGGKALEAKRCPPPPSCVPRGSVPPHPDSGEAAARLWDVNIRQHATDNPQPPRPPSAGGRTHRRLISPSKAPLESGTIVSGPRSWPDDHPPEGRPADLHMQMRHGGGGEGHAWSPPSVPSGRDADPAASCHGACSFVPPFEESKQTRL